VPQEESDLTRDIMMLLDATKVLALKEEFEAKEDGLTPVEFVHVMLKFLRRSSQSAQVFFRDTGKLVASLTELFAQIDINGDGTMEWSEFTTFIIETGKLARVNEPTSVLSYRPAPYLDRSYRSSPIQRLYYFPAIDRVAGFEAMSNTLKLYTSNCQSYRALRIAKGIIVAAAHIPSEHQIVVSTTNLELAFYDDQSLSLTKRFAIPCSQSCLLWSEGCNTLFSAGISGAIYAWDVASMDKRFQMGGIDADGRLRPGAHRDMVLDLLEIPSLESLASASMVRVWICS
jgi:hypothetical protein